MNLLLAHSARPEVSLPLGGFVSLSPRSYINGFMVDCETALSFSNILLAPHSLRTDCLFIYRYLYF